MAAAHSIFVRVRLLIKNLRRVRKAQTTMKVYEWRLAPTNVVFYASRKFFSCGFLEFIDDPFVQIEYLVTIRILRTMRKIEVITCLHFDIE